MRNPLNSYLQRHGLSDGQAAELLGWHPATVNKIRRDKHESLSLESAVSLENLTGVPARVWFERLAEKKRLADKAGEAA